MSSLERPDDRSVGEQSEACSMLRRRSGRQRLGGAGLQGLPSVPLPLPPVGSELERWAVRMSELIQLSLSGILGLISRCFSLLPFKPYDRSVRV